MQLKSTKRAHILRKKHKFDHHSPWSVLEKATLAMGVLISICRSFFKWSTNALYELPNV